MKKFSFGKTLCISLLVIVGILLAWGVGAYNSLVSSSENVKTQTSRIETQLQRRADLIPNLVSTVKSYVKYETEIFTELADARSKLLSADGIADKSGANTQLSGAVTKLLALAENYPELKADKQYQALTDELAGTENRVAVARNDYNTAVQSYNNQIKRFPGVIIANMFGFNEKEYFAADAGTNVAPKVNFD